MDWEKQVGRKSYSYAYRAQRYYNEFGNLDVPEDYNDMMGSNLHEWVKRQWRLYHRPTTDKSDAYISKKKELENLALIGAAKVAGIGIRKKLLGCKTTTVSKPMWMRTEACLLVRVLFP